MFPATSVACREMELGPGVRFTEQVNPGLESTAAAPLQVTDATPEMLSLSVPLMAIVAVLNAIVDPPEGETTARLGGVLSKLTVTETFPLFPATSVAVPVTMSPLTSLVMI